MNTPSLSLLSRILLSGSPGIRISSEPGASGEPFTLLKRSSTLRLKPPKSAILPTSIAIMNIPFPP